MLRDLVDAVMRLVFGHTVVENGTDWKQARDKSSKSRAELEAIIRESENSK